MVLKDDGTEEPAGAILSRILQSRSEYKDEYGKPLFPQEAARNLYNLMDLHAPVVEERERKQEIDAVDVERWEQDRQAVKEENDDALKQLEEAQRTRLEFLKDSSVKRCASRRKHIVDGDEDNLCYYADSESSSSGD